jgi:hypothetical protein
MIEGDFKEMGPRSVNNNSKGQVLKSVLLNLEPEGRKAHHLVKPV